MWSEQGGGLPHEVISGHPGQANNVAAAMLAYDVPHRAPWGLPVSAYVWTKAIAAGSYLVAASLVLLGVLETTSVLWKWTTPLLSAIFLAITLVLLVADLKHPGRFYMIFTRPQWRSWIVRGAVILAAFSAVLGAHLLWSFLGNGPPRGFALIGALLAIASGTYTAWLFAQAKARDLWQSPLLPVMHLVATILAGSTALLIAAAVVAPDLATLVMTVAATATVAHLILIAAEVLTPHPTAHARLAVREMVRGRYRIEFAAGVILQLLGLVSLPFRVDAAVLVLLGLLLYEHAHVGAGQAVPLA
jgi:formate-dependent nitrite reductase membrane component NrfD